MVSRHGVSSYPSAALSMRFAVGLATPHNSCSHAARTKQFGLLDWAVDLVRMAGKVVAEVRALVFRIKTRELRLVHPTSRKGPCDNETARFGWFAHLRVHCDLLSSRPRTVDLDEERRRLESAVEADRFRCHRPCAPGLRGIPFRRRQHSHRRRLHRQQFGGCHMGLDKKRRSLVAIGQTRRFRRRTQWRSRLFPQPVRQCHHSSRRRIRRCRANRRSVGLCKRGDARACGKALTGAQNWRWRMLMSKVTSTDVARRFGMTGFVGHGMDDGWSRVAITTEVPSEDAATQQRAVIPNRRSEAEDGEESPPKERSSCFGRGIPHRASANATPPQPSSSTCDCDRR